MASTGMSIRSTISMSKNNTTLASIENAPRPESRYHDCEACLPTFLPMLFSWMPLRKFTIRILLLLSIQKKYPRTSMRGLQIAMPCTVGAFSIGAGVVLFIDSDVALLKSNSGLSKH